MAVVPLFGCLWVLRAVVVGGSGRN